MALHEKAFEAAASITAAVAEESEVGLNAKGAQQVGEFFAALYKKLRDIAENEEICTRPGTFEIYQDAGKEFRFRLKAANGETIAVSEGYTTVASCKKGVESVKRCVPEAEIKIQ